MSDERLPDGAPPRQVQEPKHLGQRLAVVALGVIVLMIAVTVIGMSRAAGQVRTGPLALTTPTYPPVTLPPYKATTIARVNATFSATWTAEAAEPTPTFTTGVFGALQDKFASFYGFNAYEGQINGRWEIVRPGTEWPTPVSDYSTPGGYGAVQVYDAISHQLIGDFRAPDHSAWLVITSVKGTMLRLKSDMTASLGFDMATDTFTS